MSHLTIRPQTPFRHKMRHLLFISRHLSSIPKPNPNYLCRTINSHQLSACPSSVFGTRVFAYSTQQQESKPSQHSDRVRSIVDEISTLTLLEVSDLTEVLRKKLNIEEMPIMAVMMPGMGFGVRGPGKGPGGGGGAKGEEVKKEKTAFDLKLEGFDAANKIKVIKEVRAFTDLGLKEAKDLVEKTPTLLKKGIAKEEAEKIIEKMKEVGAKVSME